MLHYVEVIYGGWQKLSIRALINVRINVLFGANMATLNATEARANLYKLIDETSVSHQPIVITGKRSNAVLLAEDDWKAINETLYLVSIPGMRESILEGMQESIDEAATELDWWSGRFITLSRLKKMRENFLRQV